MLRQTCRSDYRGDAAGTPTLDQVSIPSCLRVGALYLTLYSFCAEMFPGEDAADRFKTSDEETMVKYFVYRLLVCSA